MHVLNIPNTFYDSYVPLSGIFYEQQVDTIAEHSEMKIGVVSATMISIKSIFNSKKVELGLKKINKQGIIGFTYQVPSLPKCIRFNRNVQTYILKKLIKKYITEFGVPDISHVHVFYGGDAAIWLKKQYNVPYIVTEHFSVFAQNLIKNYDLQLAKRVFENSHYNIAVSPIFCNYLSTLFNQEFHYIPNVVDTAFFSLKQDSIQHQTKRFINIASLTINKNHTLLIHSFKKAFAADENFQLIIIGDGPTEKSTKILIQELGLEKCITLTGKLDQKSVRAYLHNSDYFVLSSNYETFGVVLIEAMSCGIPVISTNCGGPEAIIQNKNLGILTNNNINDFSASLIEITKNKYKKEIIRDFVLANFSKDCLYQNLTAIYKNVTSEKFKLG